jgi:hypothetical protein
MEKYGPRWSEEDKANSRRPFYEYLEAQTRIAPVRAWRSVDRWMNTLDQIKDKDHEEANELEKQYKVLLEEALNSSHKLDEFEKNELGLNREKE